MNDPITEPFRRMAMLHLIDENKNLAKDRAALIEALRDCITCLEHGQPPIGGYTDTLITKSKAILAQVEGKGTR